MNSTLENNLRALAVHSPELAGRICEPVNNHHVAIQSEREATLLVHGTPHPLQLSEEEQLLAEYPEGEQPLFVVGTGLGEQLNALVQRVQEPRQIIAWERDPWLLRLSLSRYDFQGPLLSGQLQFKLGVDLIAEIPHLPKRAVVYHPFLKRCYHHDVDLLESGLKPQKALIRSGSLFVDDLADALRSKGYSVYLWDTHILSPEELARTVRAFEPNVVAAINYVEGIAELCQSLDVPFLCWEIDPATHRPPLLNRPCPSGHIFTYRDANQSEFRDAGFENVSHMPLATNPARRFPLKLSAHDRLHYQAPLSFVGASMANQASAHRHRFIALAKAHGVSDPTTRLERLLERQREDYSTFQIPTLLEDCFPGLAQAVSEEDKALNIVSLVGEISGAEKRFAYISGLSELGVHVWGDPHWDAVRRSPITYRGQARHFEELTRIYCASQINIDIGRIYQSDIITMRVFDVLGCGGFLLTEENDALAEHFAVGEELVTYRTLDELRRKALYYLNNPDKARSIARRGHERVLKDHTIAQRVDAMLEEMALS